MEDSTMCIYIEECEQFNIFCYNNNNNVINSLTNVLRISNFTSSPFISHIPYLTSS